MKAEDLGIPDHYKDPSSVYTEQEVALFLNRNGVPLDETFVNNYTRSELGLPEYKHNFGNDSGPKISNQGSFFAPLGMAIALPVGLYYSDQYLFDGYITDRVIDIYNKTIDYLFSTDKQTNSLSKKMIVEKLKTPEQQGSNNPMEYYEDTVEVNNNISTIPPQGLTKIDDGPCTRIENDYCDGTRMYELYLWYKNQPSGWWNKDGDFTPADFLAMMLIGEATGGDPEFLKAIMIATSNQLWGSSDKHTPYCTDSNCDAGIFNFIGDYMQSASERYNGLISNDGNPSMGTLRNLTAGQDAADSFAAKGLSLDQIANDVIYNPVSKKYNNDVPTQWGVTGCGENCQGVDIPWLRNLNSTSGVEYNTEDRCGIYDFYGTGDVQAVVPNV